MNFKKFRLLFESAERSIRNEVTMPKDAGSKFNDYLDFSEITTDLIFELKKLNRLLSEEDVDDQDVKNQCQNISDNDLNKFTNNLKYILGGPKTEDSKNPTPQEVKAQTQNRVEKKTIDKKFKNIEDDLDIELRNHGDDVVSAEVKRYFKSKQSSNDFRQLSKKAQAIVNKFK